MTFEYNLCLVSNWFNTSIFFQTPAPLKGPIVNVTATGKNSAQLTWKEIPIDDQQGFLINYTIFYKTGKSEKCKANQFWLLIHVSLLYILLLCVFAQVQWKKLVWRLFWWLLTICLADFVVPSNTYSCKLTGLASDSHYVVHILVSNQEGSKKGSDSSFHTKKYGT